MLQPVLAVRHHDYGRSLPRDQRRRHRPRPYHDHRLLADARSIAPRRQGAVRRPGQERSMATIEEVREFWNVRPCNIRHSPRPIGSREYFDEVETRKYFVEPHIPGFAQFERWKGKKV